MLGRDTMKDKPSHTVYGPHLSDRLKKFKDIVNKTGASAPPILDDVDTFIPLTKFCTQFMAMPVLLSNGNVSKQAIFEFGGEAPQYTARFEVPFIEIDS